jgi:hypothetical protein
MVACVEVMAGEAWNDERLDDLNARIDRGFDEVKGEVRELRKEMNTRFGAVDARLDGLNRSLVIGMVSMTASIVGALLVTQL